MASHTMDPNGTWAKYGCQGVTLFFVMSGFLITGILLDARASAERAGVPRAHALRAFFARRTLRIFPVYYLTLAVAAFIHVPGLRENLLYYACYLSNWKMAFDGFWHRSAHFWSLAVEEQFYVFWPFVVLFTPRRHLPWAVGAIVLFAPILRVTLLATTDIWSTGALIVTPSTFDSLGLGALLALAWRSDLRVDRIVNWAAALALPVFIFERSVLNHDRVWSMLQISWPFLCLWCVHRASRGVTGAIGRILSFRPLRRLGTVSYGMYLFHLFVTWAGCVLERRLGLRLPIHARGPGQFAMVMALSALGATLSYTFVERPLNSLKERFPYVPTVPGATVVSNQSTPESLVTNAI